MTTWCKINQRSELLKRRSPEPHAAHKLENTSRPKGRAFCVGTIFTIIELFLNSTSRIRAMKFCLKVWSAPAAAKSCQLQKRLEWSLGNVAEGSIVEHLLHFHRLWQLFVQLAVVLSHDCGACTPVVRGREDAVGVGRTNSSEVLLQWPLAKLIPCDWNIQGPASNDGGSTKVL